MKSITFEEHYVIDDIQKETMSQVSADPNGVPMKVMLEGLEKNQVLLTLMKSLIMINELNSWMNKMYKCKYYHTVMVHPQILKVKKPSIYVKS